MSAKAGVNAIQGTGNNITIEVRGTPQSLGDGNTDSGNGIYVFGDTAQGFDDRPTIGMAF